MVEMTTFTCSVILGIFPAVVKFPFVDVDR